VAAGSSIWASTATRPAGKPPNRLTPRPRLAACGRRLPGAALASLAAGLTVVVRLITLWGLIDGHDGPDLHS